MTLPIRSAPLGSRPDPDLRPGPERPPAGPAEPASPPEREPQAPQLPGLDAHTRFLARELLGLPEAPAREPRSGPPVQ